MVVQKHGNRLAKSAGMEIGMRTEVSLEIIEPQRDIDLGLIGAHHPNRRDDAAVVCDVARKAASIREGEQIHFASIGQIAEGAVCYGVVRHCRSHFLPRPGNVSSAMPDLSRSPNPSVTMRSNCFLVASVRGRLKPFSWARESAMPLSFAAWAPEKKHEWSRFCISSPSVLRT